MKKVLFVAPSLQVGGMERMLVTIVNKLVQSEYDVTLLLLCDLLDLKDEVDPKVHMRVKYEKKNFGEKIPYIRHKFYDRGMWETRASAQTLHRYYLGDEKFDAEVAFFRGIPVKIVSGSTNPDAVRVAWVHNDFRQAAGYQNNFRNMKEVYRAYSRFNHVVCVSQQAQAGFIQTVGDTKNTRVIYNMLPVGRIRKLSEKPIEDKGAGDGLRLVSVARLENRAKGQSRLIEAVLRLHAEGKKLSLTLVGGGKDGGMLRELIRQRHADSYIQMVGEKKNPYPYIKAADLLVCSSYYEGFNLTVAEALILNKPVLSVDCTGPSEILDHGKYGMMVENSGEGLYRGIKAFCDNPPLLKIYEEKAAERMSFFDEEKILHQIICLLEK